MNTVDASIGEARTVGYVLADAAARLRGAEVGSAALDARLLLAAALNVAPAHLVANSDRILDPAAAARFGGLVARRLRREPLAQILGHREFWSLEFIVTPDTLIPRPDSETVVEAVLAENQDRARPLRILDLGVGTGCLLLSLLSELPAATGVGVDRSARGLRVAHANALALGLLARARFAVSDWAEAVSGCFDVVVSNPPYIADDAIANLSPEIARFEPRAALAGGADGLVAFRRIAKDLQRLVAPSGIVALEVGVGQADGVEGILDDVGFRVSVRRRDLGGIERCIIGRPRLGQTAGAPKKILGLAGLRD